MIDIEYRKDEYDSLLMRYMMKFSTGSLDRIEPRQYVKTYSKYFPQLKDKNFNFLEIGMHKGTSWHMWSMYFGEAQIYGIDISNQFQHRYKAIYNNHSRAYKERVHYFIMDSTNYKQTDDIMPLSRFGGFFDVIIDDGDHTAVSQVATYHNFKDRLKPGGLYFIEDINDKSGSVKPLWDMLEDVEAQGHKVYRYTHTMDYETGLTTDNRGGGFKEEYMVVIEHNDPNSTSR